MAGNIQKKGQGMPYPGPTVDVGKYGPTVIEQGGFISNHGRKQPFVDKEEVDPVFFGFGIGMYTA